MLAIKVPRSLLIAEVLAMLIESRSIEGGHSLDSNSTQACIDVAMYNRSKFCLDLSLESSILWDGRGPSDALRVKIHQRR